MPYVKPDAGGGQQQVGTDDSDSDGTWSIQVEAFYPGEWYAKVGPSYFGGGGGSFTCKADRSNSYFN